MIRLDDDHYIDTSLITHIEYQLFLDEQRGQGKYYQPDHWPTVHFARSGPPPWACACPMPKRFVSGWLNERSVAGAMRFRLRPS